jgi:hypothetical protein
VAESRRERAAAGRARASAAYSALFRCTVCRRRGELELHELAPGRAPLDESRAVVLCPACHRRADRGEFPGQELQLRKLRLIDIFENVGAE